VSWVTGVKSDTLIIPKHAWLTFYVIIMGMGTIQVGWGIMGNAQTSLILNKQFGWTKDETKLNDTILSVSGLVGVMVGSMFGGPVIVGGRRRAIFIMSAFMALGVGLTMIFNMWAIAIGRFITGCAGGIY